MFDRIGPISGLVRTGRPNASVSKGRQSARPAHTLTAGCYDHDSMVEDVHPGGDELKAYGLGTPFDADLERVEVHLRVCRWCQNELARRRLVELGDPRRLRSVHITEDGPIFGALHFGTEGRWMARHWGWQLDGYRICESMEEADAYLTKSFQEMFPEHLCSGLCSDRGCSRCP